MMMIIIKNFNNNQQPKHHFFHRKISLCYIENKLEINEKNKKNFESGYFQCAILIYGKSTKIFPKVDFDRKQRSFIFFFSHICYDILNYEKLTKTS